MKNTPLICVLALALATTMLSTGGDACKDTPSMAVAAACHKATTGTSPTMFDLCMKTLGALPPVSSTDLALYAVEAANAASKSYDGTVEACRRLLGNATAPLTGELRAAYAGCVDRYDAATGHMARVLNWLGWCWFTGLEQDGAAAVAAVEGCADKLRLAGAPSPLYGMVVADREMSTLTSLLSGLVLKQ